MTTATEIPKELIEKIHAYHSKHKGDAKIRYPSWVREPLLKFFESGMKATAIDALTGVPALQIYVWARKQRAARKKVKPEKFKEFKIVHTPEAEPSCELRVRVGQADIFGLTLKTLARFLQETGQLSR